MPGLRHDPWPLRQRPWPMSDAFERWMHEEFKFPVRGSSLCHQSDDVIQDSIPAPHFLHSYTLIISMFRAAFLRGCGVGREAIGIDSQRAITLVFGVSTGQPRSHGRA